MKPKIPKDKKIKSTLKWNLRTKAQVISRGYILLNIEKEIGKKNWLLHANNKGADMPVHPRSLISAFIIRYLENMP